MDDLKHVAELMKGVESWNAWFEGKIRTDSVFQANLIKANLDIDQIHGTELLRPENERSSPDEVACLFRANLRGALLWGAIMNGANLKEAHLEKAELWGTFLKKAILREAYLESAELNGTVLQGADLWEADLRGAKLHRVEIEDAKFIQSHLQDAELHIQSMNMDTSFRDARLSDCLIYIGESVDRAIAIHVLAQGIVCNAQFADPVLGRKVRDQAWLNKWLEDIERLKEISPWKYRGMKILEWLWRNTSDYGRNTFLWALWSVCIAVVFAAIYTIPLFFFPESLSISTKRPVDFFTSVYFSVVTITTLGFGDVTPMNWWMELIVTVEVVLGYVMLGGLIAIFATKVARRND